MAPVRLSLLDHRTGTGTTLRLAAPPETSTADLVAALRPFVPSEGELFLDDRPVVRRATVGDLELVDGTVISVGGPAPALFDRESHGGVDVLVTGGPDAGGVINLGPGRHEVGRDDHRSVALKDPEVSRKHAQLDVSDEGVRISDLGSANTTIVDGIPLTEPRTLAGGEYVRLGRSALTVAAPEPADTALVRGADGTLTYNRRFRSATEEPPATVEFPSAPDEEPPPSISLIFLLMPMVAGLAMAAILRNPLYLMFAVLGPVTGIGGMVANRRQHRSRQARQRAKHDTALQAARVRLHEAHTIEVRGRRLAAPDPATLVRAARGPRRRLWERRPSDPDFLELRIGLADQPSLVKATGELAPTRSILPDLPVTVPLLEADSIGIAGPLALASGIARSLVFQVATLHSPSDVRLVVISAESSWSWTRWLPHVRGSQGDDQLLLGADPPSTRARLDELDALIAGRRKAQGPYGGTAAVLPRFVVLFDRPSRLDRTRVARILAEGPPVGVHAICVEETEPELPEEYAGASVAPRDDRMVVRVRNRPTVADVHEEIINIRHCELAARCLAPLRPESTGTVDLPGSVRFLDLIGLPEPDAAAVVDRWSVGDGRCRATVGTGPGGPLEVELDDRAPHGLVAGTSGAGKSEFLKTFLAGLAVANHPDDLQFLLVDFKGGGDFRTLARLPHTVDLVTNTDDPDQAAVKRALELLEAEVERRQRLVNEHGARDLATYRTLRTRQPDLPVLGRLLVVADEFGELASRQPDLLDKMVSVARVGRAMGVHLLLATQRPSGSITGQIQANVPLRLCFRVLEGEADEVIGSREPESISRNAAGRGYVRYGDEPATEFQCARVANARPSVAAEVEPLQIDVEAWATIGHQRSGAAVRGPEVPDPDTDLWTVVEAVIDAATAVGWEENPVPWPRPLPDSIRFSPRRAAMVDGTGRPGAHVGLRDDPRLQRHVPHPVVLGGGNLAVVGSSGSGRTTALRTIAAGLAYAASPGQLHLHAIDLAGGGLRSLRPIPHVGTITDEPGLAARLLDRIEDEVERRRGEFSVEGWANLGEQWSAVAPLDRLPALVLLVDGWDAVADLPGTARAKSLAERIAKVLADGSSVGVQGVIAGDRSVAGSQIGRVMAHRLVLRFNDPADYGYLDVDARSIPRPHPPGRALVPSGRGVVEHVQLAHVGRDAAGPTQAAGLRTVGAHLASGGPGPWAPPWRLAALPLRIPLGPILDGPRPDTGAGRRLVPVGVGGDEATPVWCDLDECRPGLVVAGPSGSGRTTALHALAQGCLATGSAVVVGLTRPNALKDLAGTPGVRDVVDWGTMTADRVAELLAEGPAVFLVDDADLLEKHDPALDALLDGAATTGARLIAAGNTEAWRDVIGGWLGPLRRSRHGLLLWPRTNYDGNALGLSEAIPPELQFGRPAGRAVWSAQGRLQVVQVPQP